MHILSQLFLPQFPMMSKLERIIYTRAVGISFIENFGSEIQVDRIILELTNYHYNNNNNLLIISVFMIYFYGYYKFYEVTQTKLQKYNIYDNYKRTVRDILFILFLVFSRDVQNAT